MVKKDSKGNERYYCSQCGEEMLVIEYLISDVCMQCCKDNHKKVCGLKPKRRAKKRVKSPLF